MVKDQDQVGIHDALNDTMIKVVRFAIRFSSADLICTSLYIHRRGGVVHDQDAGVDQERARDGDMLRLPAGKRDAAFADQGIVAVLIRE